MAETEGNNNNNNNQENEEDKRNPLPRRLPTKNNKNRQRQEEEVQQQWQPHRPPIYDSSSVSLSEIQRAATASDNSVVLDQTNNNHTSSIIGNANASASSDVRNNVNNVNSGNGNNKDNNDQRKFPIGYRFRPNDDELINHYLRNKIRNLPLSCDDIHEVEVYRYSPQQLAERYDIMEEKEMYFFTPRDRKYKRGSRPNRTAGNGFWKATGAERKVEHKGKIIGHIRTLAYYEGQPGKGDKTNWKMHEFRVEGAPARVKTSLDDMRLDDWVLCRIYETAGKWRRAEERDDDDDGDEAVERNNDNHIEMSDNLNQIGDTNVLINNPLNEYIPPDIDVALSELPQSEVCPSNVLNFIGTHIPNHSAQPISYSHRDPSHFQPASYSHLDLNLHLAPTASYSHPDHNQHLVQPTEYSHPDTTHHSARPTLYSYLDPNHSVRPVCRQPDPNHLSAQRASHSHLYPTHHSARPTSYSYLDPNRSVRPVTNREPDPNHLLAQPASHSHLDLNLHLAPTASYSHPDHNQHLVQPTDYSHPDPTHHSARPTLHSYLDPNHSVRPVCRQPDPNHLSAQHASHSHLYPSHHSARPTSYSYLDPNRSVRPITNREPDPNHLSARPASHSHLYPTHHSFQHGQKDIIRSRNIKEDVSCPKVQEDVWGTDPGHSNFDFPKPLMELDINLDNNDPNLYPNLVNDEAPKNALPPPEDSSTNNAPDLVDNSTQGSQFGTVSEQKESNN